MEGPLLLWRVTAYVQHSGVSLFAIAQDSQLSDIIFYRRIKTDDRISIPCRECARTCINPAAHRVFPIMAYR